MERAYLRTSFFDKRGTHDVGVGRLPLPRGRWRTVGQCRAHTRGRIDAEWYGLLVSRMVTRIQPNPHVPNIFLFNNCRQMFAKLHWELEQLQNSMKPNDDLGGPRHVAYAAFNFAVTAWHLTDWSLGEVFEHRLDDIHAALVAPVPSDISKLDIGEKRRRITKVLMEKFDCFRLCHDLANGDKHRGLSRPQCAHLSARINWHPVKTSNRLDDLVGFSISISENGNEVDAVDLFEEVAATWQQLLLRWGLIGG